jgi:predicted ABC-type ATPase
LTDGGSASSHLGGSRRPQWCWQINDHAHPFRSAQRLIPTQQHCPRRAIAELKTFKEQGRSFTYETTLSSNTSLREIDDAKAKGYEVRLYFVALDTAIQSAFRVQDRVLSGGHDIPADAIVRRFEITFAHAVEAVVKVDRFELIDNHRGKTKSVLLIENGVVVTQDVSESARINRAVADLVHAVSGRNA